MPVWWDTPDTAPFVIAAEAFVAFVTTAEQLTPAALLHEAHLLLPGLYSAALRLPHKRLDDYPESDGEELDEENGPGRRRFEWQSAEPDFHTQHERQERIEHLLGPSLNRYAEIFDPFADPREEAVSGSIADDIVGIQTDLMRGLARWRAGDHDEAVFYWRNLFESHWSEHVTGALRAIRSLSAQHDLDFPGHPEEDG